MNRALVAGVGITAVVFATAAGCTSGDDSGIRTGTVGRATVTEVVEAPATVAARAVATVTAPSSGRVAQLFVADGQRVEAGDLLAVLSSPSASQQLAQAREAQEAADAATVDTGGVDLVSSQAGIDAAATSAFRTARAAAARIPDPALRAATLAGIRVAEAQYRAAAAAARAAAEAVSRGIGSISAAVTALGSAQRVQADTAVALAQAQVDALTLRAPVGGTVQLGGAESTTAGDLTGLVDQLPESLQGQATQLGPQQDVQTQGDIAVGSVVGVGTAVATVVDLTGLGLVAEVDETDVLLVEPGTPATVDLDALPGATFAATVRVVGLLPTTSSRGGVSYRVKLALGAGTRADGTAAPQPRPGMSAVARLEVGKAEDAVAVPAGAVVRDGSRDAVWAVEDGRAVRRRVQLGVQGEDVVQVTGGLSAGQRIVVAGADRVRAGQDLP